MYKTLYIDVPNTDSHSAHRQVIATLTHYGFQVTRASTHQRRKVARVKVAADHCTNDHEQAAHMAIRTLPLGSTLLVEAANPFE
jgi:hypothetical protein